MTKHMHFYNLYFSMFSNVQKPKETDRHCYIAPTTTANYANVFLHDCKMRNLSTYYFGIKQ